MAKYEDYVKARDPEAIAAKEIEEAAAQQATREETPPETDWQKRYKDLEVAYSRQGQQIGDYRKLIDEYVTATPESSQIDSVSENPITPDDLYENPDEAVRRAVDSHPAILEARQLKADLEIQKADAEKLKFMQKHPDVQSLAKTPEFVNWVNEDETRLALAQRADKWDLTAADALFMLYDNTQTPAVDPAASIEEVGLETGTGAEPPAPDLYSRSHMFEQKVRAKQGDREAMAYVKAHGPAYRQALGSGNVRD